MYIHTVYNYITYTYIYIYIMFYLVCWLHHRVLGKRITVVKSPCLYRRETGRRVAWSGEIEFQKKGNPNSRGG